MNLSKIYKNKKVVITGHTGFKGSWLTLSLKSLGAKVLGVSNNVPSVPSNYSASKIYKEIQSVNMNVKEIKKLKKKIINFKPDFIFHLAAQSLVSVSFKNPRETWETNLLGTLNILESKTFSIFRRC